MRISGHVTRSVFDCYDIGSEDDLIDAAKKFESRRIERAVCNWLISTVREWRNWQTRKT